MGEHDKHRQRMRKKFFMHGLEGLPDHEVLEIVLYYAIDRMNTNEIAHRLIDKFGSFKNVVDAPAHDLMQVKGVGEVSATLLKLIPELCRLYFYQSSADHNRKIKTAEDAMEFLIPKFLGRNIEECYVLLLNKRLEVINSIHIASGNTKSVGIDYAKIVQTATMYNANFVIIAHNHLMHDIPSDSDIANTYKLAENLSIVDIVLIDHIIVCGHKARSLIKTGQYKIQRIYDSYKIVPFNIQKYTQVGHVF